MSPASTRSIASRDRVDAERFGMKPEAPNSMQRRITAGSSLADTITTGTLGYCARRYISPEKPRTPGMVRSSSTRSTSPPCSSSAVDFVEEPASSIAAARRTAPDTASRKRAAEQRMVVGDDQAR